MNLLTHRCISDLTPIRSTTAMPSYAPRSLEPYKKRQQLEQRIEELQAAVRCSAAKSHLLKAAERLRAAGLGVVKARKHLIDAQPASLTGNHPQCEALMRQLANLEQEHRWWSSASAEEIVEKYAMP